MKNWKLNKSYFLKKNSGITLLELVLALGISCMLITMVFSIFYIVLHSANKTNESLDLKQKARISLNFIEKAIRECNQNNLYYDVDEKQISSTNIEGVPVMIDLSGKRQTKSNTLIYFHRANKQLRTNRNGEHNVLIDGIRDVEVREIIPGKLLEIEVFVDKIEYSIKTRFNIGRRH